MKNITGLPRRFTPRNDGMRGFTLIELLVAMGIIGVLTAMAAFNFNLSRIRARDVQRKSDLDQMQKTLELYKNDTGAYPDGGYSNAVATLIGSSYIKKSFNDPKGAADWIDYEYVKVDYKNYYLMSCLENAADTARTTVAASCTPFARVGCVGCRCGHYAGQETGAMYIVSQP